MSIFTKPKPTPTRGDALKTLHAELDAAITKARLSGVTSRDVADILESRASTAEQSAVMSAPVTGRALSVEQVGALLDPHSVRKPPETTKHGLGN